MSIENAKKEIVLELTNDDAINSRTVQLFKAQPVATTNNQSALGTLQTSDVIDTAIFPSVNTFTLTYDAGVVAVAAPASITALVDGYNATLTENGAGTLWFEMVTDTDAVIKCASSLYDIEDINDTLTTYNFTDSTSNYISGTSVSVDLEAGGVTYNELVSELSTQPYVYTTLYVKADTASQLGQAVNMNYLQPNGTANLALAQPTLDPNSDQFVNYEVPLYMPTSALNNLEYTLEAGESVRLILRYEHTELFDALKLLDEGKLIPQLKRVNTNQENIDRIEELIHNKAWEQMPISGFVTANQVEAIPETLHVPLIYSVLNQNKVPHILML